MLVCMYESMHSFEDKYTSLAIANCKRGRGSALFSGCKLITTCCIPTTVYTGLLLTQGIQGISVKRKIFQTNREHQRSLSLVIFYSE